MTTEADGLPPGTNDPRFLAAIDLVRRTGAADIRIGFSDPEDGEPTVWYSCATYPQLNGAEAAAALDPLNALFRLCTQVIDGGVCTHCRKPSIFIEDMDTAILDQMGCVYAWDPEMKVFRRQCE